MVMLSNKKIDAWIHTIRPRDKLPSSRGFNDPPLVLFCTQNHSIAQIPLKLYDFGICFSYFNIPQGVPTHNACGHIVDVFSWNCSTLEGNLKVVLRTKVYKVHASKMAYFPLRHQCN